MAGDDLGKHILGIYKPGDGAVISDSSRDAGVLGETVLLHELAHHTLTLESAHGQCANLIGIFLWHFRSAIPEEAAAELDDIMRMLAATSSIVQEGYATWFQLACITERYEAEAFDSAFDDLPQSYRDCLEVYSYIQTFFGNAANFPFQEMLGGVAVAALDTSIFATLAADPYPRRQRFAEWLRFPMNVPDARLEIIVRHLAQNGPGAAAERFRLLADDLFARATDENERELKYGCYEELRAIGRAVAASAGISLDDRDPLEAAAHMQTLIDQWCEALGVEERLTLTADPGNGFRHRYTFDTIPRKPTTRGLNGAQTRLVVRGMRERKDATMWFAATIGPWYGAWTLELTGFADRIANDDRHIEQQSTFTVEPLLLDEALQIVEEAEAVLVLAMWVVGGAPEPLRARLLGAKTRLYIFAETTSIPYFAKSEAILGPVRTVELYPASLEVKAELAVLTYGAADAEFKVLALVDPIMTPHLAAHYQRAAIPVTRHEERPQDVSMPLLLGLWACTYGNHGYAASVDRH